MYLIQISSGPVGVMQQQVRLSASGRSARTKTVFVPAPKRYLVGWEQTGRRIEAEPFETYDAARKAIHQAREDGTIRTDERAIILCDD